ncbi:MAG: phosphoglycerate kinase [Fusobacteria bacterium]|nr:phosphoglycerate kinase [Fusobacteriota bacterium]
MNKLNITSMRDLPLDGKKVLLRLDINSPIDIKNKKIVNTNRIDMSLLTLEYLISKNCKIAIIAHQGDTLDYQNLIPLKEHAGILSKKLNRIVEYVDDVCGMYAVAKIQCLKEGEIILLGNLRYLSEEISTFETVVPLKPPEMKSTYLVRQLVKEFDFYINDAFAAAHRNAPSMVGFQEHLISGAGDLFFKEVSALNSVMTNPQKPSVFVLGGAKISDAFGMMKQVLENNTADKIITLGIIGEIFLIASGVNIGKKKMKFLQDRKLDEFIESAKEYLKLYAKKIEIPRDLAFEKDGKREEIKVCDLPIEEMFLDIGKKTISDYEKIILEAKSLFANGPAGVYENPLFELGTRNIMEAISRSSAYSVIGGGDTVTAATKFIDLNTLGYVCTAGGAMVRYLTGKKLPLIEAMEKAYYKLNLREEERDNG